MTVESESKGNIFFDGWMDFQESGEHYVLGKGAGAGAGYCDARGKGSAMGDLLGHGGGFGPGSGKFR